MIIKAALDGRIKSYCKIEVDGEKKRLYFAEMRCPEKGQETRMLFFNNLVAVDIDGDRGKSHAYLMNFASRLEEAFPPESTHKTHSVSWPKCHHWHHTKQPMCK